MVNTCPFKGLAYNQSRVENLSEVLSPPYDVIPADLDTKLRKLSPYNIINLILPQKSDANNKYTRANLLMQEWIKKNILKLDSHNCYYLIEESFELNGILKKITGFIGLTRIEEYESKKVLRHENTLSKPKEDRLKLLESTRTNFGLVYTVYRDDHNLIRDIADSLEPNIALKPKYDDTLNFKLWKINQPNLIDDITRLMANKPILIADGHHRYETSRLYYQRSKLKGLPLKGQEYILTLFVNSKQKDIAIYPTFRLIKLKNKIDAGQLAEKAKPYFNISFDSIDNLDLKQFMGRTNKRQKGVFLIYLGNGQAMTAVYKKEWYKQNLWNDLDVNILHNIFLKEVVNSEDIQNISFTHSWDQLKNDIDQKKYSMGILLNAPTVNQVETLSRQGFLMPQKSTYFYPKPCTGLVMYKFED